MAECRGLGHSVQRKEDARFIRGQGRYIDDVKLPGMLYLDIARSPYAHAKITKIHEDTAMAVDGVAAVITGKTLEGFKLAWMPTLMSDQQMVLPVDTVKYQAQEVAAIVATSRYAAADGAAALEVDYDPLPVVVDPHEALKPGATKVRDDKESNHIFHWEHGDADGTDAALAGCDTVVEQKMHLPRIHVASIETCGCVASWNPVEGHLTLYLTTQAPHAIRTVVALVTAHLGLAEHKIRVISPDIGGGFGGKVPVYPGYVLATAASVVTGKPVKWIEDRSENLQADSFARDYHITAKLGSKNGKVTALKLDTVADHGYSDAAANPSKFPAGLYHIATGSYDLENAHVSVDGVYTNKPPGGIAYRCSFRVTEAVHAIERMVDLLARENGEDPADFRLRNFIKPEQFPYQSALGWEYDSGNYGAALEKAMDMIGYQDLRAEQAEKARPRRADGRSASRPSPRSWAPARRRPSTSWGSRCSTRPRSGSTPPGRRSPASAPSPRGRGTRPPTRRSSRRNSGSRRRTSRSRRGTRTRRPTASAPTPAVRPRPREPRRPSRRGRSARRGGRSPRISSRRTRPTSSGSRGSST